MCVGKRDLHRERAPAKIFINLSRKYVLKMKNKQMYKCNLREIHYASLQQLSGRCVGDGVGVGSECRACWGPGREGLGERWKLLCPPAPSLSGHSILTTGWRIRNKTHLGCLLREKTYMGGCATWSSPLLVQKSAK